jgi:hypothetical protein
MDTPIRLRCTTFQEQKAFLGLVTDPILASVATELGAFTKEAIRMVLGREFLENENRYRVNTDISSRFMASLLDLGGEKVEILMLLRKVFRKEYLGDDVNVLVFAEIGFGIPWANDLPRILQPEEIVPRQPFLLNLDVEQLTRHRKWAQIGRDFLRKWHNLEDTEDYRWLEEFSEIILSSKFHTEGREPQPDSP